MPERYLKVDAYAERMNVSVTTVKRWISKRIITARRLKTGGLRIPESQIENAFIGDANPVGKNCQFDIDKLVAEVIVSHRNYQPPTNRR